MVDQPALVIRVLIVGCGAIGNEVAKKITLMGVKNMTIVDFDEIKNII